MRTAFAIVLALGCASSHETMGDAGPVVDGGHDAAPDPIDAALVPVDAAPTPCAPDQIMLTGTVGGEDVSGFSVTDRRILDCDTAEYHLTLASATQPNAVELLIRFPFALQYLRDPPDEVNASVLYTLDGDRSGGGSFSTSRVDLFTTPDGMIVGHLACDTPEGRIEGSLSIGYCDFNVCL